MPRIALSARSPVSNNYIPVASRAQRPRRDSLRRRCRRPPTLTPCRAQCRRLRHLRRAQYRYLFPNTFALVNHSFHTSVTLNVPHAVTPTPVPCHPQCLHPHGPSTHAVIALDAYTPVAPNAVSSSPMPTNLSRSTLMLSAHPTLNNDVPVVFNPRA
ncbi:hypothetical protein OF83DRAFT_1180192, partial [Amylostereum chailletii]